MTQIVWLALGVAAGFALSRMLETDRGGVPATRDPVRNAGPDNMRDPPSEWDRVDELSDESFPASDAPGKY